MFELVIGESTHVSTVRSRTYTLLHRAYNNVHYSILYAFITVEGVYTPHGILFVPMSVHTCVCVSVLKCIIQ